MSVIIVESLLSVTVDGNPSGTVVDVLANSKFDERATLLDALLLWESERFKSPAAEIAAIEAKYAAVIEKLNNPAATKDDAKIELDKSEIIRQREELQEQKNKLDAQSAEIQVKIDAL